MWRQRGKGGISILIAFDERTKTEIAKGVVSEHARMDWNFQQFRFAVKCTA